MFRSAILCLLCACGGERVSTNTAQVCVSEAPFAVSEDAPLALTATAHAGCHTEDLQVRCTVTLEGSRIAVETETTWVRTEPLALACESVLFISTDSCSTPDLPPGAYVIAYADQALDVDVPGIADGCIEP